MNKAALPPRKHHVRVGLLGGAFNPAHEGHVHISLEAKKRLGLDEVWWLVSPHHPTKDERGIAPLAKRMQHAQALSAKHRFIRVTDIEDRLDTSYTCDTLAALKELYPHTQFVWLMGADNLVHFHRWRNYLDIAASVPIAVLDRHPYTRGALSAQAAQRLSQYRVTRPRLLLQSPSPAWAYVRCRTNPASSTALRAVHTDWHS